jgi:hypothetical protein
METPTGMFGKTPAALQRCKNSHNTTVILRCSPFFTASLEG